MVEPSELWPAASRGDAKNAQAQAAQVLRHHGGGSVVLNG